jgi:hypothetical protein
MSTSAKTEVVPEPTAVHVTDTSLTVDLADGRTLSVPLQWFPRLVHATPAERQRYELSRAGIHWDDLNEDISIAGLLQGKRSGESQQSLQRWLTYRARGEKEPIPNLPLPPGTEKELRDMGISW